MLVSPLVLFYMDAFQLFKNDYNYFCKFSLLPVSSAIFTVFIRYYCQPPHSPHGYSIDIPQCIKEPNRMPALVKVCLKTDPEIGLWCR